MSGGRHAHHHHDHDHHHGGTAGRHRHGDGHRGDSFGRAFAIGIVLNVGFVIFGGAYGFIAHSTALLADAGHNLSDVLGLVAAWGAAVLAKRPPSRRFTYGLGGASILAALFNAVFLMLALGAIAWEAIQRFGQPATTAGGTVAAVAAVGILINGVTAWMFAAGRKGDLNIRGAFLHMAGDAAVSAGVVVAGVLIALTGWSWLDPATSLVIVAVIVWGTWDLLRDSLAMSLKGVPGGIDVGAVEAVIAAVPGCTEVHDLHVWAMSTRETALTAHMVMPAGHPGDEALRRLETELHDRFGIGHATVQVEISADLACRLRPDGVA